MNCTNCGAYREDQQTGDVYCQELGALIQPAFVDCPRQQDNSSLREFREYIINRFSQVE